MFLPTIPKVTTGWPARRSSHEYRCLKTGSTASWASWRTLKRRRCVTKLRSAALPPARRFRASTWFCWEWGRTAIRLRFSLAPSGTTDRLVVAVWVPGLARTRISMTPRILNAARRVIFLTAGTAKAPALAKVLEDPTNDYPAKKIQPSADSLTWMVDKPAASLLSSESCCSSRLPGEDH